MEESDKLKIVQIGGVTWYRYGNDHSFEENIKKFQDIKEREFTKTKPKH